MNLLTHIAISKLLYRHLSSKMKLSRRHFIYGNIKPDLNSKCLQKPHTIENFLNTVCSNASNLINEEVSLKEYSIKLGETCHYICDFFCQYHLNEDLFYQYYNHFIYELKLQIVLLKNTLLNQTIIQPNLKKPEEDIHIIIEEMRKRYDSYAATCKRDIVFAFSSTIWICESVSYFLAQQILEDDINSYPVLAGHL